MNVNADILRGIVNLERFVGHNMEKRPINPKTGSFADTTDANTWSTLDIAKESVSKYENVVGVGFVLGKMHITILIIVDTKRDFNLFLVDKVKLSYMEINK